MTRIYPPPTPPPPTNLYHGGILGVDRISATIHRFSWQWHEQGNRAEFYSLSTRGKNSNRGASVMHYCCAREKNDKIMSLK